MSRTKSRNEQSLPRQLPPRAPTTPGTPNHSEVLEGRQILPDRPRRFTDAERPRDVAHRGAADTLRKMGQDPSLPFGQVPRDPLRRHVSTRAKAHRHAAPGVLDLRARQPGGHGQLNHLDRAPTPRFDNAASIEDTGDERIPG